MSSKNPVVLKNRTAEKQTQPESETETAGTSEVIEIGTEKKESETVGSIVHKGFQSDDERQQMINYAYEIGGMDLVTLIECENGGWLPFKQSDVVKNGVREKSYGLCQISQIYHPNIVNTNEFWSDWKRQIDKCNELMRGGTAFYGRDRKIKGVKCSTYVLDRFEINNGNT